MNNDRPVYILKYDVTISCFFNKYLQYLCNHWFNLTELASKLSWAFTRVLVDTIHTGPAILTHVVVTVINVCRTVLTTET